MIGVIDYGAGNLGSVMNALKRFSVNASFVSGPEELIPSSSPYEKIIFPGDGHFATSMASLEKSGFASAIKEWINADKPFLGICIGLQLLFENSEEAHEVKGLCVIPGTVKRFPGRKVPQIGWNQTITKAGTTGANQRTGKFGFEASRGSKLFKDIKSNTFFYYIHSYYVDPCDNEVCSAFADYYVRYCCAIERGALAAVQFHPEKSGEAGIKLLENWIIN